MNLAFQAFLLLLVYLPGAAFMQALFGRLSKDQEVPVVAISMTGRATVGMIVATVLHTIWQGAIAAWHSSHPSSWYPMCGEFFTLLASSPQQPEYTVAMVAIRNNLGWHAGYFLSLLFFSLAGGMALYARIKSRKLERRYRWMRVNPSWHYVLNGDDADDAGDGEIVVMGELLTEVGDQHIAYSGVIHRFWFDEKTGELLVVVLQGVLRMKVDFAATQNAGVQNTVPVSGDLLAVPAKEIKNLSVVYVK